MQLGIVHDRRVHPCHQFARRQLVEELRNLRRETIVEAGHRSVDSPCAARACRRAPSATGSRGTVVSTQPSSDEAPARGLGADRRSISKRSSATSRPASSMSSSPSGAPALGAPAACSRQCASTASASSRCANSEPGASRTSIVRCRRAARVCGHLSRGGHVQPLGRLDGWRPSVNLCGTGRSAALSALTRPQAAAPTSSWPCAQIYDRWARRRAVLLRRRAFEFRRRLGRRRGRADGRLAVAPHADSRGRRWTRSRRSHDDPLQERISSAAPHHVSVSHGPHEYAPYPLHSEPARLGVAISAAAARASPRLQLGRMRRGTRRSTTSTRGCARAAGVGSTACASRCRPPASASRRRAT